MNDHIELHQGDLIGLNPEIKMFLDKIRAKSKGRKEDNLWPMLYLSWAKEVSEGRKMNLAGTAIQSARA